MMMRSGFRRFASVFAAAVSLSIVGCGGGSSVEPPVIAAQPQAATVNDGAAASFSVTASGQAPLSYQWQKNGVAIPGATGPTYTTPPLTLADSSALFSVVVANSGGSQTSLAAVLTVNAVPPVIIAQPRATTAAFGSSVSLSVQATGSPPLNYQWFRAGVAVPGATSSSIRIDPVPFADDGVSYTVQISNSGGAATSQAAILGVTPASKASVISQCQEITGAGSYVLLSDLGPKASPGECIAIHDVIGVQLDCANHVISGGMTFSAISVTNVQNFSVKNCQLTSFYVNVNSSSHGIFSGNQISHADPTQYASFQVNDTSHFVFDSNTVMGAYTQFYGDSNTISNNRITATATMKAALVGSNYGVHTRVLGNVLDGAWNGQASTGLNGTRSGADDGITSTDETDLVIENNLIKNVWDCGIESSGLLSASTIRGNHIVLAGYCGIGGWYWTSLLGNAISQNIVENSANLFQYERTYGLRPAGTDIEKKLPADTAVFFKDNVFDGNALMNQISRTGIADFSTVIPVYDNLLYNGISSLPGEVAATPADFKLTNNLFKNNQFGTQAVAPWFGEKTPIPGMVVDGGGNSCQKPALIYTNYPLKCN